MALRILQRAAIKGYFNSVSKCLQRQDRGKRAVSLMSEGRIITEKLEIFSVEYDHDNAGAVVVVFENAPFAINPPFETYIDELDNKLAGFVFKDASNVSHTITFDRPLDISDDVGTPDIVDEAGEESFPASDPPSWTGSKAR